MIIKVLSICFLILTSSFANAFCGFYVAKADTTIFNKASKVVLVRDGDKTVLTMANDFQGDVKEFAVVIPVPTAIEKGQVHVGDKTVVDHLDAFTSPRLVEYFDSDPCEVRMYYAMSASESLDSESSPSEKSATRAKKLGVTIEAAYTVGEYDIMILSAKESDGLAQWLNETGYKMPKGTEPILKSYINQKMKFFIAKVNLEEQSKTGFTYLRPLQVAYESPKFMLPIRLGTVNSNGPQELFILALTKNGRIETTNYRTVKLPSDVELPPLMNMFYE